MQSYSLECIFIYIPPIPATILLQTTPNNDSLSCCKQNSEGKSKEVVSSYGFAFFDFFFCLSKYSLKSFATGYPMEGLALNSLLWRTVLRS